METQPWTWDWSALAAFFAAGVAVIATAANIYIFRKTKDHNAATTIISYREKWLSELRMAMARFLSNAAPMSDFSIDELNNSGHLIRLMLNPEDEEYDAISKQISVIILRYGYRENPDEEIYQDDTVRQHIENVDSYNSTQFNEISQRILKREWEKIKLESGI